ncbi:MAG: DEAD/DEAH box helicase [Bacteroidetes bacterium]|nr:DEAD/DEAH box helicase [Bacteroidota bacterium]MCY4206316.1 DEAD/DEAH box helicase [Bacteroidota bacterium]
MSKSFKTQLDFSSRAQQVSRESAAERSFTALDPNFKQATPESLGLGARAAFEKSGWPGLMPVQAHSIPCMESGQDLIVQSRTGSGKTGAFLLPLFDRLDSSIRAVQALILTPTRELAGQIHDEFKRINPMPDELRCVLVYGGVGYKRQSVGLSKGAQVVIGTPGRILDHLERRTFTLAKLRSFILDEADEMLSMGFYPAMVDLKSYLPEVRQSCMFSATMPPKVRLLGREFLKDAQFLGLSADGVGVATIDHRYYSVLDPMERARALSSLIEFENPESAIIFTNTRREVSFLKDFLSNYGFNIGAISGDFPQRVREKVIQRLREGHIRLLVATDVAARGIDISELSHVFQYEVPLEAQLYIHRTGRTARAGKAGVAITLASWEEESQLKAIARQFDIHMEKRSLPDPEDVAARTAQRVTVALEEQLRAKTKMERERLAQFVPMVKSLAEEEPELIAMLVDELNQKRMNPNKPQQHRQRPKNRQQRSRRK